MNPAHASSPGARQTGGGGDAAPDDCSKLRVLDLFSGIGGFSLGLERTGGFETVAFCEIEPFPRRVLAKHWPEVPLYDDVRTLTAERLAADGIAIDVICGGFPCQDISFAGLGAGLAGERSGLFYQIARLVGELGPRFVILENVGALLSRGLDAVLGTLASLGYDAEWHCIPASAVGAPHRRDRVWIIAHPAGIGRGQGDAHYSRRIERISPRPEYRPSNHCEIMADASRERCAEAGQFRCDEPAQRVGGCCPIVAHASIINAQRFFTGFSRPQEWAFQGERSVGPCGDGFGQWAFEPDVGRVANGVPDRAHRLKALGNAVVPAIPELIGRAILRSMEVVA
jgi:DNA (cytosine-5)-methyltransferase 1